eukprot:scaffold24_cov128-Cylindrotheca_fusiformis.AAC.23
MTSDNLTLAVVAGTAGILLAMVVRTVKRSKSPVIECKLACPCGAIQGKICAKREDSLRVYCYCSDCRNYTTAVAEQGKGTTATPTKKYIHSCGECHLVMVCKNALTIEKGQDKIKLARKRPDTGMHRYYAGCCQVPLMNVVKPMGFVSVYEDNLDDEKEKFDGPLQSFTENAIKTPLDDPRPDLSVLSFLSKQIPLLPWKNAGPFDYSLPPAFYWEHDPKKTK